MGPTEVVLRRHGWIPRVVRSGDGTLRVALAAGANANHDPREFSFPIEERHLEVLRDDLARHLLLWCAVLPLCDAAGTQGDLDEDAAVALLDTVLLGTAADVDRLFQERDVRTDLLVGHGADLRRLARGQVLESLHSAREQPDHRRVQAYQADRERARRGVTLAPLDEAVLKFVGHYLHGSTLPGRHPEAVDPARLPEVMEVITVAEGARAGVMPGTWKQIDEAVRGSVRRSHPSLVDDALRSVAWLMCSESAIDRRR